MAKEGGSTQVEDVPRIEEIASMTQDVASPEVEKRATVLRTEGKKFAIDVSEQVVDKRSKLPSQYVISSFTTETKKRTTFIDGTYPNLFCNVDHAKWKHLRWSGEELCPSKYFMI